MDDVRYLRQLFERFLEKYDEHLGQLKERLDNLENSHIRTNSLEPEVTSYRPPFRNDPTVNGGHIVMSSVPRFAKMDFPSYDGSDDPLVWLSRCEYFFKYQHTPKEENVGFTTFHILGDAQLWFIRLSDARPNLTWNDFRNLRNVRFGLTLGSSKLGELAKLQQIGLVVEYDHQFEQLFARTRKLRPKQEIDVYVSGLKEFIRVEVVLHRPTDLSTALNIIRLFERRDGAFREYSSVNELPPFIKRLSCSEIEERKAIGLCYSCDDPYTPRHQCKKLFWLEMVDDFEDGSDWDPERGMNFHV